MILIRVSLLWLWETCRINTLGFIIVLWRLKENWPSHMRFISTFNLVRDFNHILMLNMYFNHLKWLCVCVCVCACVRACVCVCVCSAPDVSVVNSSVSGHEGGDISVQCLYSSGYQNEVKRWCRYKYQSCYTVGRTVTSQNSSVQISDDGRRSFTVLMTGLRRTDSGWYFCFTGNKLSPVHLTVTETEPDKEKDTSVFKSLLLTFLRIVFVEWICISLDFVVTCYFLNLFLLLL